VPSEDALAIREALESLKEDNELTESLRKKSRARVEQLFDAQSITLSHTNIYNDMGVKR